MYNSFKYAIKHYGVFFMLYLKLGIGMCIMHIGILELRVWELVSNY